MPKRDFNKVALRPLLQLLSMTEHPFQISNTR